MRAAADSFPLEAEQPGLYRVGRRHSFLPHFPFFRDDRSLKKRKPWTARVYTLEDKILRLEVGVSMNVSYRIVM